MYTAPASQAKVGSLSVGKILDKGELGQRIQGKIAAAIAVPVPTDTQLSPREMECQDTQAIIIDLVERFAQEEAAKEKETQMV